MRTRRRLATLLVMGVMMAAMLVASGVAWAVNKVGTDGPDTLRGTNADDNLLGRGGNDYLFGSGGNDNLLGGAGNDWVLGTNERGFPRGGDKNLAGGDGNDVVRGSLGSDNISGGAGNDLLSEGDLRESSVDNLSGGAGIDVIIVSNRPAFKDRVACGAGFDGVLADREDVVAPDCEKVLIGGPDALLELFESIPERFFEGLPPPPE